MVYAVQQRETRLPRLPNDISFKPKQEILPAKEGSDAQAEIISIDGAPASPHEFLLKITATSTKALTRGLRIDQRLHFTRSEKDPLIWVNENYPCKVMEQDGQLVLSLDNPKAQTEP
jgi:hypothetical protein